MNPKRTTLRHITKMSKVKEEILNAIREKQLVSYKGTPMRLLADFLPEKSEGSSMIYSKY